MATKKNFKGELGGSGTSVYNGVVADVEYNSTLSTGYGSTGLRMYNRMRKSDPVIKSALQIVKLGILQAEWMVEAGEDNAKGDEVKEFVEDALFERMNRPFNEVLKDILTYLDFGFYVGEKVFKLEDNKIWLKKLAFRAQTSIKSFQTEDKKDGVTQVLQGDKLGKKEDRMPSIPIEKLLIFSNEKEGDNWRGVSILRSAYKPWFMKENYEKIDAIGFERERVGLPVFKMPANPDPDDSTKADELGQNIRANEKAYLKLPSGWEFEIIFANGNAKNADDAIKRFNRDILSNVLAHFLDLGSGSSGSRALSTDQSDAFYRSLQATADYIASVFNEFLIKQLVDFNFDGVTEYPKLGATGIEKVNIESFTNALQRLSMAGLITPDDDLEDHVRGKMRLPARTKDTPTVKKVEKKLKPDVGDDDKKKEQKKKREFKDVSIESKPEFWRELTFAEEKVNLHSLARQMDRLEAEVKDTLTKTLAPEVNSLISDARQALQTGDIKRVEDIFTRFKSETMQTVLDNLRNSFEAGKLSAANEITVGAPKMSTDVVNLLTTRANTIAEKITSDLLSRAKFDVMSHIEQGTPLDEAMSSIEVALQDQMALAVTRVSSVVAVGGINTGRQSVFDTYPERIFALQRSEILDGRVCNFCISLDGRVVMVDDDITKQGQFHFNCRGIWVSILIDEEEKPEIGGVPSNLRERIGTLNEFEQIPKPQPLKGSLAEDFTKKK